MNNTSASLTVSARAAGANALLNIYIPAKKGDIVMISMSSSGSDTSDNRLDFIYAVGSESEAS